MKTMEREEFYYKEKSKLYMKTTNIAFGTGICMQNNWKLIETYLKPEYLSDNASSKWHTFPMGKQLECIPPEKIKELENPYVLITIGDPYIVEKIKQQMADMKIPCGAIVDYLDQWGATEPLPKHLEALSKIGKKPRILLFNSPEHDNVGDHMISIAELKFIDTYFSDFECIEITDIEYLWFHNKIRKYINSEDIILITGGGFLGSMWLYNGELNVRNIIEEYSENKIIIMPQTVFFEENERGEAEKLKTVKTYKNHSHLTVALREEKSFQMMHELLGKEGKCVLIPDMALSLNYSQKQEKREGVLLCLREDKESILKEGIKRDILSVLNKYDIKYYYTLMHTGKCFNIVEREDEILQKASQMKAAELVITDTLHGMLLCTITGTPCLAFDNISHKVSGVYEWIKNIPYIHLYKEGDNIDICISKLLENGAGEYKTEILASYYEKLAKVIGEKDKAGRNIKK